MTVGSTQQGSHNREATACIVCSDLVGVQKVLSSGFYQLAAF